MDAIERYFKLQMYLLCGIGLWPYTEKNIRTIHSILVSILLWLCIIMQLGTFVTFKYTMTLFLKNISPMIMTMGSVLKHNAFWYQIETVKYLMDYIKHDWNTLNVDGELAIIKKHAEMGTYYTQVFALFIFPSACFLVLCQFRIDFLNVMVPLNESRSLQFPVMIETVFDQQKYFYYIAFFLSLMIMAGAMAYVATEGLMFMWVQHIAGMFEIVRFYHHLQDTLYPTYIVLLTFGIMSLSINLFRLSQLLESPTEVDELLISGLFVVSEFAYMYYVNYMIQKLLDSSNKIFRASYNTRWYETPVVKQKMLLFIMSSNIKDINVNLYGLYDSSIQGFATLVKMSLSYFMGLYSVQG